MTTVESIRCYDRTANRRLTMDDLQGNVIDGTARARQWRLARSKARAESDGAEARSDAPKSIAGSLLVPADMLSMGVPGDDAGGGAQSDATAVPTSPDVAVTHVPQNGAAHQNPFLVPEAGRAEDASVPARTRLRPIARLLTRTLGRGLRRGDRHAHERFTRQSAREHRRHLRWATGMIAGVATARGGRGGGDRNRRGDGPPGGEGAPCRCGRDSVGTRSGVGLSSQAQGRHGDQARASGEREDSRTPRRQAATSSPPRDAPTPILIAQAPGPGQQRRCVARRSPGERDKHRIV